MNTTLTKKQQVQIVFSILNNIDPLNFYNSEDQESEYLSDAKEIVNALAKRRTTFFFWIKIREIFLDSFEMKVKIRTCRKIAREISFAFSNQELVKEVREIPALKNIDENFTLKVHNDLIFQWSECNFVNINGYRYTECEEQDLDELGKIYTNLVKDNSVNYVLYKKKPLWNELKYVKVVKKDKCHLEEFIKDKSVSMIVDNKALLYKAN